MFECLNVRMFECLDWKQLGQLVKTTCIWCAGAGPCGTTLATAYGSDLRSVDILRSSRFALTQPDACGAGESLGDLESWRFGENGKLFGKLS